jgi:hypothetical protein
VTADELTADRIRARFDRMRVEREAYWGSRTEEELLGMRIAESEHDAPPLMRLFLSTSVPLWIDRVRYWRPAYREQKAHEIGEEIAASQALVADENVEGRVGKGERGDVADGFNLLAQGLALLAFCPGGVVFAGHHWEVTREPPPPTHSTKATNESTP